MSEEAKFIFDELKKDYTLFITREEYAEIAKVSIATVVSRMNRGVGLPNYKRAGNWKNAKILFNLRDVAEFMAGQTVKTV